MKRSLVESLVCPECGRGSWNLVAAEEDAAEVREGRLDCEGCRRSLPIRKGILHALSPSDQGIAREIEGWKQLAGPLGEDLVPIMAALPFYPHEPWIHTGPDFLQLFEHVDFHDRRVVDIGAGRTWSSRFVTAMGRAREVVAIDVLTERFLGLETADVYFAQDQIYFERICGDMHHVPLKDGWADVVVSCASIHHSSDLQGLFSEVWRLLRPGGLFAFTSEPVKKASIPDRQPQNEETAHGINEHIYSFAEYMTALRRGGFRPRHLSPRTIRFRCLYPDDAFLDGLPRALRSLRGHAWGRRVISRLVRGRLLGPLVYRFGSLPLTVLARKPGP